MVILRRCAQNVAEIVYCSGLVAILGARWVKGSDLGWGSKIVAILRRRPKICGDLGIFPYL